MKQGVIKVIKNFRLLNIFLVIFFIIGFCATSIIADELLDDFHSSSYEPYEIYNEENELLSKMARVVTVGDELIARDNKHYRVKELKGRKAIAEYIGKHDINISEMTVSTAIPVQQDDSNNVIAIYHTHSAESYVPSDGTESIPGNGGIFDVGEVLTQALEGNGFTVIHDLSAHEPHDSEAYNRSRRTATELLEQAPAAIIDVHRDGIPDPDYYREEIEGEPATRIRLVVGRQNQNMESNLEFAKHIKATSQQIYPELISEIFLAKGNYNQDLSPRSILIEVGTHTNSKEEAQNGAKLFADVMPNVMGITPQAPSGGGNAPVQGTDTRTIFWILALTIIGIGAFLVISTGSVQGAIDKLKQFTTKEWANLIGGFDKKKDNDKNRDDDN
jgi:stage II sporulation protein P